MLHFIENSHLRVAIDSFGAQPMSIIGKDGIERLWQGDPEIWKGRAPILFPFIGRLKNEQYTVNGKEFKIAIHGFAQRMDWDLHEYDNHSVTFVLRDNEKTREQYPFSFELFTEYRLDNDKLIKIHTIHNMSDSAMYYEIGGHDGYRTTLTEFELMADSYIEFPGLTELHPIVSNENVMLTQKTRTVPLKNGRLYLTPGLFAHDALILKDLPCQTLTLGSDKNEHKVVVSFDAFPFVGIWSRPRDTDNDYVCIEPWSSLPDCVYLGTELSEKIGVRQLAPSESETLQYSIRFI